MVGFEILFSIRPEKRGEFIQSFDMLKELDQLGQKRIDFKLFEQVSNPNSFLWLEHWDDEKSVESYFEDNKFRAMMGAISIMGQVVKKRTFSMREEGLDV